MPASELRLRCGGFGVESQGHTANGLPDASRFSLGSRVWGVRAPKPQSLKSSRSRMP